MGFGRPCTPVADSLKPGLPYVAGAVLEIQQCQPHAPFGPYYRDTTSRIRFRHSWTQCDTPSRFCLQNPPLNGKPMAKPKTRTIIIDGQIACGDGLGAQVVKCHYDDGQGPIVAKLFDPLYYPWPDFDPTYQADDQFTTEATAFITLQDMDKDYTIGYPRVREALKGSIPRYYGSYTWETQLLDGQRRDVRLILMEYIPCPSMASIIKQGRVASIPVETRMQLLARAFEIFAWLEYYGVDQHDFAPRNIMVDPDQGRVVLLDFSFAKLRDRYNSKWSLGKGELLPVGPTPPIEQWHCDWPDSDMLDWVPKYLHSAQARYDWFRNQWSHVKIFQPLSWFWYNDYEPRVRAKIERESGLIEGREIDIDSSASQSDEY